MTKVHFQASQMDSMMIAGRAQSAPQYTAYRRKQQRQFGRNIARKRLLRNVTKPTKTTGNNGVLTHHRQGGGDLYLTGESSQYCNCAFLDGRDVILAASIHGDIDVLRLPTYLENNGDKEMTVLTSKMRLLDSTQAYSVSTRYKLKPFRNGHAFAVGTPSGAFSIFSTEHASTWSTAKQLSTTTSWKRPVQEEPFLHNNNILHNNNNAAVTASSSSWAPYIANHWQFDSLQNQSTTAMDSLYHLSSGTNLGALSPLPSHRDICLKPHSDALWDFWESPSCMLAAHGNEESRGRVTLFDSRTIGAGNVSSIGISTTGKQQQHSNGNARKEKITAICFASEMTLLTAHARPLSSGEVDNTLRIWDIRKTDSPVDLFQPPNDKATKENFISFLTPSTGKGGKVLITTSSHQNHSSVQHSFYDLGRNQLLGPDKQEAAYVHQRNRNNTSFATNSEQAFMACYETSQNGGGRVRLFDLDRYKPKVTRQPTRKASLCSLQSLPRKRRLDEQGTAGDFILSSKTKSSEDDTLSTCTSSSSEGEDSDAESNSDDHSVENQGFECVASFKPKLVDRYGLTTHLACMAMNDLGTAFIGGSYDGDIFAWRGS